MSSGQKMRQREALAVVRAVVDMVKAKARRIEFAGSLRRDKLFVGDAEVVFIPSDADVFLAHLHMLVWGGRLLKARYVDKNGRVSHRWGEKYRGVILPSHPDFKVELFAATMDNWGYIQWLRTGPGDANQYVMQMLRRRKSKLRFAGGQAFWGGLPIAILNERMMFDAIGVTYAKPHERTLGWYREMERANWRQPDDEWFWQRRIEADEGEDNNVVVKDVVRQLTLF